MVNMIPELLRSRHAAPRRKFRGRARYFRKIRRNAQEFAIERTEAYHCDLCHYHADWPGWGNLNWAIRLEHIKALAVVYRKIVNTWRSFDAPFQCWIYLDCSNAGYDGTFLHTPGVNRTNFPVPFESMTWDDQRLLPAFQKLLPEFNLRVGRICSLDVEYQPPRESISYFIFSPDAGVPL